MSGPKKFPTGWASLLVLMPHPDDPEYGVAAAVAKWTAVGKTVHYVLACRGEAGIEGMAPAQAGPIREVEQRRSAAAVGVEAVDFWDFPDSEIRNTPALRAAIASVIDELKPDVVVTIYGGSQWDPGLPNQRDHIEFAAAVIAVHDALLDPPRWLFQNGPQPTHIESVVGFTDAAIEALAAHETYLSVLDPDTPMIDQARHQIGLATAAADGHPVVGFVLVRGVA